MYSITTQQIEAFLTISKYKNLSKASETMFISQPALSKILQRLEERIGVRLFVRGNHGLSLTSEGEYLYKALEPLYKNLNEVIDIARSISRYPERRLRFIISSAYDVSEVFLEAKDYVTQFSENHVDVEMVEVLSEYIEIRNALEFTTADIAITYDFILGGMKNISYKRITEFELFLAMSSKHELAKYDDFPPLERLTEEVFYRVSFLDDDASREIYMDECGQAGFSADKFVFVPNMQTLFHALTKSKGLSLCTKFKFFGATDDIKYYALPPFREKKYTVTAWNTDRLTPEARLFINMLPGKIITST